MAQCKRMGAIRKQIDARMAIPGAMPPSYHLVTREFRREVRLTACKSDYLYLSISRLSDMIDHEKSTVSVKYDLGFPKDSPIVGSTSAVKIGGTSSRAGQRDVAEFKTIGRDVDVQIPIDRQRPRELQRHFSRRKVRFEVMVKTPGFFQKEKTIGKAELGLEYLLDHCQLATTLNLTEMDSRREVRGRLEVELKMAFPLGRDGQPGKEFDTEQIPELVVGDWPGPTPPTAAEPSIAPAATAEAGAAEFGEAAVGAAGASSAAEPATATVTSTGTAPVPAAASSTATAAAFSTLTDQEKKDPLSVQFLFGEAVLGAELELAKAANDDIRIMTIESAQSVLEIQVSTGQISGPDYLQKVEDRNGRDKLLCRFLISKGRKSEAARVLKRTKIMDTEITGLKEMFAVGPEEGEM